MNTYRLLVSTLLLLATTFSYAQERIIVFPGSTNFSAAEIELEQVNNTLLTALKTQGYKALPVKFTDPRSLDLIDYLVDSSANEKEKTAVRKEFVMQVKEQVQFKRAIFTSVVNRPAKLKRGKIIWDDTRQPLTYVGDLKTGYGGDITKHLNQASMTGRTMENADYNALSLRMDVFDFNGELIEVKHIGIAVPYVFDTEKKKFKEKKGLFKKKHDQMFLENNIAKALENPS